MTCTRTEGEYECSQRKRRETYLDVKTVLLRPQSGDLVLLGTLLPQVLRLEDVSESVRTREHRRVELHTDICTSRISKEKKKEEGKKERGRTESLPIERHKLHPRRPHMMRRIVTARQPTRLRISPRQMPPIVRYKVLPRRLIPQHLVHVALPDRDDVRRGVRFLLVEPAGFDTDCVDEERGERVRHGHVVRF